LKASLYNAKILNWLILNRKNIEDRLRWNSVTTNL
jgi:hypothetical protein